MVEEQIRFEFTAPFHSPNRRVKKRGNFKPNLFFDQMESFICCLSSSVVARFFMATLAFFRFNFTRPLNYHYRKYNWTEPPPVYPKNLTNRPLWSKGVTLNLMAIVAITLTYLVNLAYTFSALSAITSITTCLPWLLEALWCPSMYQPVVTNWSLFGQWH